MPKCRNQDHPDTPVNSGGVDPDVALKDVRTLIVDLNMSRGTGDDRPYITITPNTGVNVVEGENLEIRCDVDSNPAPSSVIWSKVGGQPPSDADTTSGVLRITSTHRTDRGTYRCVAVNSIGSDDDTIVIDIYYPPDIHVLYTNTTYTVTDRLLTCVPDGNPASYQFGQWRHIAEDGTEIRQLTGSSNTTHSVLTLSDPGITRRYEDTGYYTCTAYNNIPGVSTSRTESVFFVVQAPPVVITNTTVVKGQLGNNITIEVEFYSRPSLLLNVTWTKGSNNVPLDNNVTSVNESPIQLPFHGIENHVDGFMTALTKHNLVEQDFGNYTVTIENNLGLASYQFDFKSASPPVPPDNFEQLTHGSSSITVQWTPRFNGGAEQHFVIGYRTANINEFIDLDPIPDQHEPTQPYQITGLTAGTTHYIRMYAENEIGRSVYVYLNQTTAAANAQESSVAPLVGGISGSAVGLIVIAVVAVIIFKRRTTEKHDDLEMINRPGNISTDEDSDGMKQNVLYESSDGLKANVLYESAGANYIPEPVPSSEYASVSKPKKQNVDAGDPSSLYAVVDKSGKDKEQNPKNDVYAEVKKLPKEKGGKGKKKQPKEQKQPKEPKGGKKKKKTNYGNGGDVYENVTPKVLEEQVYANDGSNGKSEELPCSRRKNKDGLVYLEVEFKDDGNTGRRAVIHGIENRNDYADIDFTKRADPLPDLDEPTGETEKAGE
ncbi:neural cell adhesion molecule 1-like [Argopecten irradians]|uniref:neural cell adhesion molecule 1-like n=1 Tax=Argopecten irradians TaxID=31199 RepID=UPI00371E6975